VIGASDIGASELAAAQGAYTFMAAALITLFVGGAIAARKLGGGFSPWAWGGVAFVLSQAARLPVLTLISALFIGSAAPESGSATWALSVLLASLTAGIFEEGSRALILSTAAKRVRSESSAIAFGLGHAGIEALIFTLLPSIAAIALLSGVSDGSIYTNLPAASSDALKTAVTFLSGQSVGVATLAVVERIFAALLHITLTLLVVRAVQQGGGRRALVRRLVLPITLHTVANLSTVLLLPIVGVVGAEVIFAAVTLGVVGYYLRTRTAAIEPSVDTPLEK
jgi:hypothetical protein